MFTKYSGEISLPPVEYGCTSDNDCPDYTACQNRKCINPCAAERVCAPNAICTVTRHKAVCACPDGFIGTPEITCTRRKYKFNFISDYESNIILVFKVTVSNKISKLWVDLLFETKTISYWTNKCTEVYHY